MLLVIGGLPGTGKSTLAHAVGNALGASVIGKDVIEASLLRSGITKDQGSWAIANDLLLALAGDLLAQDRTVVVDAVCGQAEFRMQLRKIAAAADAELRLVECVCSDLGIHRSRIEGRQRGIAGWPELTWADVEATRARCDSWTEDRLVVDALRSPAANVDAVVRHLALPSPAERPLP